MISCEETSLACLFLDLTQDVEERRLHSVAVERMFSETQHKAAVKRLNSTIFHSASKHLFICLLPERQVIMVKLKAHIEH